MISKKIKKCRVCDDKNLISIKKFPNLGLTGVFLKKGQKTIITPLEVVFSKKSSLLQLRHNYNSNILYGNNYGYRSGLNPVMVNHLKSKADYFSKFLKINYDTKILDIGSNDATFLKFFNLGIKHGIDPTIIKYKNFYPKKIIKHNVIFDKAYKKINKNQFNLITAIAMFYDLASPLVFLKKIKNILHRDGIFHIEVAYMPELIKNFSYDTFCQEHYEFYSLTSLFYIVEKSNLVIQDFGFNQINGGSIWLNIANKETTRKINLKKLKKYLKIEEKMGIKKVSTYKKFFFKAFNHAKQLDKLISRLKKKNKDIAALGASTKGNVLLQLSNLNSQKVSCIYDINKEKFNKFTPCTNIKILDENKLRNSKHDYLIILIWHFKNYILKKIKNINPNIKIIIPFPKIKIV
jgi:hypothetical protein